MSIKKLAIELSNAETKIKLYWGKIVEYVEQKKDYVYIWEENEYLKNIKEEIELVSSIFRELSIQEIKNEGIHNKRIFDANTLLTHLNKIEGTKEWFSQTDEYLQNVIFDIEKTALDIKKGEGVTRRSFFKVLGGVVAKIMLPSAAYAKVNEQKISKLKVIDYLSPRNKFRPIRPQTRYIIIHTTESDEKRTPLEVVHVNLIKRIRRLGLAHFAVDLDGLVYRVIDINKMAKHAGRSIWERRHNIDEYAIGIEIVAFHDKEINPNQYNTLAQLINQLKRIYKITDDRVLTHSMVAYDIPNEWHRRSHRGRKRCAMLFAIPGIRLKLGLNLKPTYDPDVESGRLAIGDEYLASVLYGTRYKEGKAPTITARIGEESSDEFEGFKEIGKEGNTAWSIAGEEYNSETTIYFLPDGKVRTGKELSSDTLNHLTVGTKILVGYTYGGHVLSDRSAFQIVGTRWNYPSTYYRFPDGTIKSGDGVTSTNIPKGTLVLFRN